MRNHIDIDYKSFEKLADRLGNDFNGKIRPVFNQYMQEVADDTNRRLHKGMKKHNRTGRTDASILDDTKPEWSGDYAEMKMGFNLQDGGIASIFLLYGTPKQKPDKDLYNSLFGAGATRRRKKLGDKAFKEAIAKLGGKV